AIDTTLTFIGRTHSSKQGILAWDLYRYPGQVYRYPQSSTNILKTSTEISQDSNQN
ncbi:hypothetical protein Golob_026425, partial [Gossypium lobatum]|nr:hypothetical protein [Gossypium lobatum]